MGTSRSYQKDRKNTILFSSDQISTDMDLKELMKVIFGENTKSSDIARHIWNTLSGTKTNSLDSRLFSDIARSSKFSKGTWYMVANKMVILGILEVRNRTWILNPTSFVESLNQLSNIVTSLSKKKQGILKSLIK